MARILRGILLLGMAYGLYWAINPMMLLFLGWQMGDPGWLAQSAVVIGIALILALLWWREEEAYRSRRELRAELATYQADNQRLQAVAEAATEQEQLVTQALFPLHKQHRQLINERDKLKLIKGLLEKEKAAHQHCQQRLRHHQRDLKNVRNRLHTLKKQRGKPAS